jgi:hypothetical protein
MSMDSSPLTICCLKETQLIDRNKHCLRVKKCKKFYQANGLPKQRGVGILISDKVDLKSKLEEKKDSLY